MPLKTVELFCGSKSFSKIAAQRGHEVFTSDVNKRFKPDYRCNIFDFDISRVPYSPDVVWASCPCTYFSVASMWKHFHKDGTPKSLLAMQGIKLVELTRKIIQQLNPKVFFIENPLGMMRKLECMQDMPRHTITYCCYGDERMKPTDIFTNLKNWNPKPACTSFKNVCAASGSTNDLSTASKRAVIPAALITEIWQSLENFMLPGHKAGETKFHLICKNNICAAVTMNEIKFRPVSSLLKTEP